MFNWITRVFQNRNNSYNRGSQGHIIRARKLNFTALSEATNGFQDEIVQGSGGSPSICRGRYEDQDIFVKRLVRRREAKKFDIDVNMLSRVDHPNLVTLIGFCERPREFLLVYPYMELGNLGDHIYDLPGDKQPLDWNTKMKITIGIARGVEYLHDMTDPALICKNLYSSNILLGEGYDPMIWEFSPEVEETRMDTFIMEKNGYLAPEYNVDSHHNSMSDVYSFGVILLEIVFGRKAVDPTVPSAESNLVAWVKNKNNRALSSQLVLLDDDLPEERVKNVIGIAKSCLVNNAHDRPSIKEVIAGLGYEPQATATAGMDAPDTRQNQEIRFGSRENLDIGVPQVVHPIWLKEAAEGARGRGRGNP